MEGVAASLDITPSRLLPTACHGPFDVPSEWVGFRFEANILALRDTGGIFVLVSLDWFYGSANLRDRILDRCAGRLQEISLFVAASHAHTSPATDSSKVGFTKVDDAYVRATEHAIADRVASLLSAPDWQPVSLRFASTPCDCSVHRRRIIWRLGRHGLKRVMALHPNPKGPRDRELRLIRVENTRGGITAIVWGISCHPTEWPRLRELSSDYPGGVRETLRAHFERNVPVLFLQGFAGDLRPPAIGRWGRSGSLLCRLVDFALTFVNGPEFVGFSQRGYRQWFMNIAACATRAAYAAGAQPTMKPALAAHRSSMLLSTLGLSGRISELTVHCLQLAADFKLLGLSAEVCWEYVDLAKGMFPSGTVWPVGYIDYVFGYLPTEAMLSEGGYEVTGFRRAFGITGEFIGNLGERIRVLLSTVYVSGDC